jgi:capsule polysaccharide export protein KpsE/RkpR
MALIAAVLTVWPPTYVARAQLMPDQSGGGLASLLGASGSGGSALASLGALIGGKNSIESDLTIARSAEVAADALRRLGADHYRSELEANRAASALQRQVDVEIVRGGIMQISVTNRDAGRAKALASVYLAAVRDRLGALDRQESTQNRAIAAERMTIATGDLAKAQAALDAFRLANRLAAPEVQLGAAVGAVAQLQARLQAEQVQLALLEKFATPDNIQVQASLAQISTLKSQLAQAQTNANASSAPTVGVLGQKISQYENLYRNEKFAEAEYEVYKRYLETVTVQILSAPLTMTVVQPPYLDPRQQYNLHFLGLLILIVAGGVVAEFYMLRPPPGFRR